MEEEVYDPERGMEKLGVARSMEALYLDILAVSGLVEPMWQVQQVTWMLPSPNFALISPSI